LKGRKNYEKNDDIANCFNGDYFRIDKLMYEYADNNNKLIENNNLNPEPFKETNYFQFGELSYLTDGCVFTVE